MIGSRVSTGVVVTVPATMGTGKSVVDWVKNNCGNKPPLHKQAIVYRFLSE
ncbi:hypothetical protein B4168_1695 [Anoxybacillus flavithermus]|nr:hypothetical protein B4168_1695 [Anoxybacillus flavithermus]OAO84351.1 hypothetical protein GT23_3886 [Parageobacillus thermoglucosidasius]